MATCSSADSVLDAASLIKSNGIKLNTFVNGESDRTVQLGESTDTPTPTLRNLVANALKHVAESMGDSVETAVATINELESGKADKVSGNVEDHIAALDMYGNLQDSCIDMDDVATKSVDIVNLDTDKADKVSNATSGHFAGLNASGNLTDSGRSPADIAALENGKADKVSGATAGDIAVLGASGDLVDSGVKPADKADKVADAVEGNFAGLDASGNLTDSGRSPADITALEEAVDSLEERKADKWIPAEPGNLAKLSSDGNLRDAMRAIEDFTPLLNYASGAAANLVSANGTNVQLYEDWYADEIDFIGEAGRDAAKAVLNIRSLIGEFDESVAQHRLQQRLFSGTNPTSSSKPVLFIICGQSNAVGTGEYGAFDHAEDCGQFWCWGDDSNILKPIVDPVGISPNLRGSQWPAFARRFFALTGRKVLLVNLAWGGSSVTDMGLTTTNTWADNGHGVRRARAAQVWADFSTAVSAESYDVGAILWSQGEADAGGIAAGRITASDYKDATVDVLAWLRTLIGASDCPVLNCMIGFSQEALSNSSVKQGYKAIQQAQSELFNSQNGLYNICSMPPLFANAWNEFMYGIIHYGVIGYQIVGDAYARGAAHHLNF